MVSLVKPGRAMVNPEQRRNPGGLVGAQTWTHDRYDAYFLVMEPSTPRSTARPI